jgi:hypothetical protein
MLYNNIYIVYVGKPQLGADSLAGKELMSTSLMMPDSENEVGVRGMF